MPKVTLYNMNGESIGEIELSDNIFGAEISKPLMHEVVQMHLANRRQGTQATKTRAAVSGGGKKPWRQKGTARARCGSNRSPVWVGGGIVFGPNPRNFSYTVPKKMKRAAIRSALSAKLSDNEIIVVDAIEINAPKTKIVTAMLDKLDIKRKALIVLNDNNTVVYKSARNIEGISTIEARNINVYDILAADKLIFTKSAVDAVEEVFA